MLKIMHSATNVTHFFTACLILRVLSCVPPTTALIITDRQRFALIADTRGGGESP